MKILLNIFIFFVNNHLFEVANIRTILFKYHQDVFQHLQQEILNLNSAVGAVAKTANALKIGIIFTDLQRNRTHPYGELEIRKNNSYLQRISRLQPASTAEFRFKVEFN